MENKDIVLNGTDVYVIRTMANNKFGNSKPCENCIRILKRCQIYRVYYSVSNLENTELLYKMEKLTTIVPDHVSRGNKGLKRLNVVQRVPNF